MAAAKKATAKKAAPAKKASVKKAAPKAKAPSPAAVSTATDDGVIRSGDIGERVRPNPNDAIQDEGNLTIPDLERRPPPGPTFPDYVPPATDVDSDEPVKGVGQMSIHMREPA